MNTYETSVEDGKGWKWKTGGDDGHRSGGIGGVNNVRGTGDGFLGRDVEGITKRETGVQGGVRVQALTEMREGR